MAASEEATEWFHVHFSHRDAPIFSANLVAAEQSPSGGEGWLFDIDESRLNASLRAYLLCEAEHDPEEYYVLAVPTRTLLRMKQEGTVRAEEGRIRLFLEAGEEHKFVDRNHGAEADFSCYQVWPELP